MEIDNDKELSAFLELDDIEISDSSITTGWEAVVQAKEEWLRTLRLKRFLSIAASVVILVVGCYFLIKKESPELSPIEFYALESHDNDSFSNECNISLSTNHGNEIEVMGVDVYLDYHTSGAVVIDLDTMRIVDTPTQNFNTLKVPAGKRARLSLNDGSLIVLNSCSRLIYPVDINSSKREVYLEGEAYFDVATDRANPFCVRTAECMVEVTGTEFNVKAYSTNSTNPSHDVVLVRGKVAVNAGNATAELHPGQKVSAGAEKLGEVCNVNTSFFTCWKDNFLQYDNSPLLEIFDRLGEIFGVEFDIASNVHNMNVSGKLNLKENLSDILNTLSFSIPINYQCEGDKIVVTRTND